MLPGPGRQNGVKVNGTSRTVYDPNPEDDPFYQKLTTGEDVSSSYFKNTRQSKLLSENEQSKNNGKRKQLHISKQSNHASLKLNSETDLMLMIFYLK